MVMSGRRAQRWLQTGAPRAFFYALGAVCLAGVFVAAGVGVAASASTKVATAARAYTCRQPMQLAFSNGFIDVVDADGSHFRRITNTADLYGEGSPVWSPDGRRIAFTRIDLQSNSFATEGDLYITGVDGRGLVKRVPGGLDPTAWSPDGRQLLFIEATGHDSFPELVTADGHSRPRDLPLDVADAEWSPDGRRFVLVTWNGLDVANADLSARKRIVKGNVRGAAWSPRGDWIAFVAARGVEVVRPDGTGRRLIAPGGQSPAWSPDAKHVAYIHDPSHGGREALEVVSPSGRSAKNLMRTKGDDLLTAPVWSPDGAWIAFTIQGASSYGLELVNGNGQRLHQVRNVSPVDMYNRGGELAWRPCTARRR
jgi:Tol biopolymer transport system component